MKRIFILVLLVSPAVHAQAIQIAAGSSTLYAATGASTTAYFTNQTAQLSFGFESGSPVFGFADTIKIHDWLTTFGDNSIYISEPGAGFAFTSRGIRATKKSERRTITIFTGATGSLFSVPYLLTARTPHFGAGVLLKQSTSKNWEFTNEDFIDGSKKTAIAGVDYASQKLVLNGATGILENEPYYAGQADWRPVHFVDTNGAHTTYAYQGSQINVNSVGLAVMVGPVGAHGSAFYAKNSNGQAAGVDMRAGPVNAGFDYFHSGQYPDTYFSHLTESIGQRLQLSQFISQSAGRTSVNYGGGYISNTFSVSAGYATYFMPLFVGRSPFQQSLVVTIGLHVRGFSINTGTNVLPAGGIRWSLYGNDFVYGPLASSRSNEPRDVGRYSIQGLVEDDYGVPVEGACVEVGRSLACTDATGTFMIRTSKQKAMNLAVDTADFLTGRWELVSVPPSQVTAEENPSVIKIVVKRR